jgi:hypothetical protein
MAQITLEEALKKIEEQKHLAEAIEQKDALINSLTSQNKELKKENVTLKTEVAANKHLSTAVEVKDDHIRRLGIELDVQKKELDDKNRVLYETTQKEKVLEENLKKVTEQNANVVSIANGYINNFRSYLKATQGALEIAVELEALLTEKVKK